MSMSDPKSEGRIIESPEDKTVVHLIRWVVALGFLIAACLLIPASTGIVLLVMGISYPAYVIYEIRHGEQVPNRAKANWPAHVGPVDHWCSERVEPDSTSITSSNSGQEL